MEYFLDGVVIADIHLPIQLIAVGQKVTIEEIPSEEGYPREFVLCPKGTFEIESIEHEVYYALSGFAKGWKCDTNVYLKRI